MEERKPMLSDDVMAMVARHALCNDAHTTGIAVAYDMQQRMDDAVTATMKSGCGAKILGFGP